MLNLTPLMRLLLTGLAAAIGVIAGTADDLPLVAQAVIVGASTVLAGLGIIPPQVKTETVARREDGYTLIEVLLVLLVVVVIVALLL